MSSASIIAGGYCALPVPRALTWKWLQRQLLDGVQDEMDDVIGGQPLAQIAGQKHRRLAIDINKTCSHGLWNRTAPFLFKLFSEIFSP